MDTQANHSSIFSSLLNIPSFGNDVHAPDSYSASSSAYSSRQASPDYDTYGSSDPAGDRKLRKNNREKQRREELNQQFESLCVLLGLHKKSEKYSVMAEAIQTISSLRQSVEEHKLMNSELRNELQNAALQANINAPIPRQAQVESDYSSSHMRRISNFQNMGGENVNNNIDLSSIFSGSSSKPSLDAPRNRRMSLGA